VPSVGAEVSRDSHVARRGAPPTPPRPRRSPDLAARAPCRLDQAVIAAPSRCATSAFCGLLRPMGRKPFRCNTPAQMFGGGRPEAVQRAYQPQPSMSAPKRLTATAVRFALEHDKGRRDEPLVVPISGIPTFVDQYVQLCPIMSRD